MTIKTKIIIILSALAVSTALAFIIYNQFQISARQEAIEKQNVEQKELANNILRSAAQYATKEDVQKFSEQNGLNLKDIQKDLNKLGADLTSVNNIKVRSTGEVKKDVVSSSQGESNPTPVAEIQCKDGKCENPDKYNYLNKEQNIKLTEKFNNSELPFGEVGFSAWKKAPWRLNILPREYSLTTVVGTDEKERTYVYNKFGVMVDGKLHEIKIDQANTKQVYPEDKLTLFNPMLNFGVAGGINFSQMKPDLIPSFNLSIASYGKLLTQPSFTILNLGIGYSITVKKAQLNIAPFYYNIGNNLPLISNTYIGPILSLNARGDVSVLIGVVVGL